MRRNVLIAAIAATLVSAASWAGPFGPGPGMGMGNGMGYGMGGGFCNEQGMAALGLTTEQRDQIAAIQGEVSARRLELMESMRELRTQAFRNGGADATRYEAMADLRQQMFDVSRDGRSSIEAVLTPAQRAQWRPAWRGAPWRG